MFAALHIPDFLIVAGLRSRPDQQHLPSGVLSLRSAYEPQEKLPLLSVNRAARVAGIGEGWPLNRALVRCPDLNIIARDPGAEASLREELIVLGESLAPDLEITAADSVVVDLSSRAAAVGQALDALSLTGGQLWHARAPTPDLAHLAAQNEATQGRVVAPADFFELPLELLATLTRRQDLMGLLQLWGLKTLGDFMKLPRQALAERLGPEVGNWHDLLLGKTCRLLRLHRPPESFSQSLDFDDAVVSLDPLVFAIKRLLHTLTARLGARHLAAKHLDVMLTMESGEQLLRQIRLPEPQTAVEGMLSPLQTWMDSLRLEAAVVSLHLDAETTFATAAQREWFGRQLPQPERWAETLAKLEALLGPNRVGIPVPDNSFRPDAFTIRPATDSATMPSPTNRPDCSIPISRFRPPREIAVAHEFRNRQPCPLALLTGPHPGEIVDIRGPFRTSGDWWNSTETWLRLEWDVQVASRHILRLVFQPPDHWQLDGIYR
jgi:protein ImuB